MGKEIVRFKSEERMALSDVSAFLRQLADKLDTQQVTLQRGSDEVQLSLPKEVVLELKVEDETSGKGKLKQSLEIEIEWHEGEEETGGVKLG